MLSLNKSLIFAPDLNDTLAVNETVNKKFAISHANPQQMYTGSESNEQSQIF